MIDNLRRIAIFASVADTGSFSNAASQLKLSTSVVSHHISELEKHLGVTLLYRSTRALSLTDEGRRLLGSAHKMLAAAEEGLDSLVDSGSELIGALSVTLPRFISGSHYEMRVWDFAEMHKKVEIKILQTDRQVDLIAEGFDLAIRLGQMPSSEMKTRKIGVFERKLVCSPAYLRSVGEINQPEDLQKCHFVMMTNLPKSMKIYKGGEFVEVSPDKSRILVDSVASARRGVLRGLGVQRLPLSEIESDLESGDLVELLSDWQLPKLDIHAVWPALKHKSKITSAFLDHITAN